MTDTAVHLEQRVLPEVPIRHWIGSLPWGLRALLGYDRRLCARVLAAFVGELARSLKRRAKRLLGLGSVKSGRVDDFPTPSLRSLALRSAIPRDGSRGGGGTSQVPEESLRACPALRPRWSGDAQTHSDCSFPGAAVVPSAH